MPLFRDGMAAAPDWCELRAFAIVELPVGTQRDFPRTAPCERLLVAAGNCRLAYGGVEIDGTEGTRVELIGPDDHFAGDNAAIFANGAAFEGRGGGEDHRVIPF